jgi:CMP-N-acetylneuraminic acid synthetase
MYYFVKSKLYIGAFIIFVQTQTFMLQAPSLLKMGEQDLIEVEAAPTLNDGF